VSRLLETTPSQTVGPFFAIGLPWTGGNTLVSPETLGERIEIRGQVLDGDGLPVIDALVEIWQANAAGKYAHPEDRREDALVDPAFLGFGRCATDADGQYRFYTIRPGAVPAPGGRMQAPHIMLIVFARGLLQKLITRVYFESTPENAGDPILGLVDATRRERLIARTEPAGAAVYRFNIVLQGEDESVFFAF